MSNALLTIVILTKNEEKNLPRCLQAIPKNYPVAIVDSGSTDGTLAIAEKQGCAIFSNPWPGFAEQRNFAIGQCTIKSPWILFVDADEIYPLVFYEWFESEIAVSDSSDVILVPSILYLRGRRLNHAPWLSHLPSAAGAPGNG